MRKKKKYWEPDEKDICCSFHYTAKVLGMTERELLKFLRQIGYVNADFIPIVGTYNVEHLGWGLELIDNKGNVTDCSVNGLPVKVNFYVMFSGSGIQHLKNLKTNK